MRKHDQNGEDIQKLEEKFRTLGIPYASQEPEPLYWANFRVRVMERIAEKERKANWPARFGQFIEEHVWGAGIAVSAACLVIAGILWLQPSSDAPPIAAVQPPPAAPAPIAPAERQPIENYATPGTTGSYKTHPSDRSYRSHEIVKLAKNQTEDLASAEEPLAATDQETPVSLQSLSQPELESVLQGLQTHE